MQMIADAQQSAVIKWIVMAHLTVFSYVSMTAEYILLPALLFLENSSGYFRIILSFFCLLLFLGLLYKLQDKLLYHPSVPNNSKFYVPIPQGQESEVVKIKTKDGIILHGYLLKHKPDGKISIPTIVYFHGNAGNAGSPCSVMLNLLCHVNVLSVDYRGYGKSDGEPSEDGLYEDAYSCVEYLHGRNDIDTNKIILFGHSLGGAVAIHTAARLQTENGYRLAALIVENTFTSIMDVSRIIPGISSVSKYLPHQLYKNQFLSRDKVSKIRAPILFIRGEKDEIVGPTMTKNLFDIANNPRSCILSVKSGSHNDTWCTTPHYYIYITKFINKVFNNGDDNEDWKWEVEINM